METYNNFTTPNPTFCLDMRFIHDVFLECNDLTKFIETAFIIYCDKDGYFPIFSDNPCVKGLLTEFYFLFKQINANIFEYRYCLYVRHKFVSTTQMTGYIFADHIQYFSECALKDLQLRWWCAKGRGALEGPYGPLGPSFTVEAEMGIKNAVNRDVRGEGPPGPPLLPYIYI